MIQVGEITATQARKITATEIEISVTGTNKEGQTLCMGSRAREGIQRGHANVNQPTCAAHA